MFRRLALLAIVLTTTQVSAAEIKWVHPLATTLKEFNCDYNLDGLNTAYLYTRAISMDIPIRVYPCTKYHPRERSGLGGGWGTADGLGFRPGCIASATVHYKFWKGHILWIEGYGRSVVGDNGPGWTNKYRFDLAAFSAREVDLLDKSCGFERRRAVIVHCPRPSTCSCDFAVASRKHR